MNWKYIRTKDGRIYKTDNYFMYPLDYPMFSVVGSNETFYEAEVEGANTIEELLDEYVVVDGNEIGTFKNLNIAKRIRGNLYGNVKGNSVAKYENGEWRLL